jgi:hypothetical protein
MATEIIPATARTAILPSQPSGLPVLVERAGGAALAKLCRSVWTVTRLLSPEASRTALHAR